MSQTGRRKPTQGGLDHSPVRVTSPIREAAEDAATPGPRGAATALADRPPSESQFYSPIFATFFEILSSMPLPIITAVYAIIIAFMPSGATALARAAIGAQVYDHRVKISDDFIFTPLQEGHLTILKNVVSIDPGIFTGLKLSPDGLSSSQVIQLASIFDTFIKSVFAHCPFTFAALVKWTPDGVVQASRQRSGVIPIFSTNSQASLSRFYGPHTLPTIHFNGDGPFLRGFPDYDRSQFDMLGKTMDVLYDSRQNYFSRDTVYYFQLFHELQRILHLFFKVLCEYLRPKNDIFHWVATFSRKLDSIMEEQRTGALLDLGVLPTFASTYMSRNQLNFSAGALAFKLLIDQYPKGLSRSANSLIANLYRWTFQPFESALEQFEHFRVAHQRALESTFDPADPERTHPALSESLLIHVLLPAWRDLLRSVDSNQSPTTFISYQRFLQQAESAKLTTFAALEELLETHSQQQGLLALTPTRTVAVARGDSHNDDGGDGASGGDRSGLASLDSSGGSGKGGRPTNDDDAGSSNSGSAVGLAAGNSQRKQQNRRHSAKGGKYSNRGSRNSDTASESDAASQSLTPQQGGGRGRSKERASNGRGRSKERHGGTDRERSKTRDREHRTHSKDCEGRESSQQRRQHSRARRDYSPEPHRVRFADDTSSSAPSFVDFVLETPDLIKYVNIIDGKAYAVIDSSGERVRLPSDFYKSLPLNYRLSISKLKPYRPRQPKFTPSTTAGSTNGSATTFSAISSLPVGGAPQMQSVNPMMPGLPHGYYGFQGMPPGYHHAQGPPFGFNTMLGPYQHGLPPVPPAGRPPDHAAGQGRALALMPPTPHGASQRAEGTEFDN